MQNVGLYKQLAQLRDLLADVRSDPSSLPALKQAIAAAVDGAGLAADVPLVQEAEGASSAGSAAGVHHADELAAASDEVCLHCTRTHFCACVCVCIHISCVGTHITAVSPPLHSPQSPQVFGSWCERLWTYLQTLEGRLFSEGLHVLGAAPGPEAMASYLGAYYGDALPEPAAMAVAEGRSLEAARAELEAAWRQVCEHNTCSAEAIVCVCV